MNEIIREYDRMLAQLSNMVGLKTVEDWMKFTNKTEYECVMMMLSIHNLKHLRGIKVDPPKEDNQCCLCEGLITEDRLKEGRNRGIAVDTCSVCDSMEFTRQVPITEGGAYDRKSL